MGEPIIGLEKRLELYNRAWGITKEEFDTFDAKRHHELLVTLTTIPISRPLERVRKILQEWASLEGHAKCWHHPEILTVLCRILEIPIKENPELPSRSEFECGCRKYQDEIYGNK